MCSVGMFSTAIVEGFFCRSFPQKSFPHSTAPVEKNLPAVRADNACASASVFVPSLRPLGIVSAVIYRYSTVIAKERSDCGNPYPRPYRGGHLIRPAVGGLPSPQGEGFGRRAAAVNACASASGVVTSLTRSVSFLRCTLAPCIYEGGVPA